MTASAVWAALAVAAVIDKSIRRGPRAASRCAFRSPARLPVQPLGVQVLAAVKHARMSADRVFGWDARLQSSAIAVLEYLWRRGRGEKWAGKGGSALYACSIAQLVMGLAPIMGWKPPTRLGPAQSRDRQARSAFERERALFVKAHRKSVQRWLDWLTAAGLVSHTPQQDEDGFWWRTIIRLNACPQLPESLLQEAARRRLGWWARERSRRARGRKRDLSAILRRAKLTPAERRQRSFKRHKTLREHARAARVRLRVLRALFGEAKTHLTQPFGASTTSRRPRPTSAKDQPTDRRLSHARKATSEIRNNSRQATTSSEREERPGGEETRWAVYRQIVAAAAKPSGSELDRAITAACRRVERVETTGVGGRCERWRLIECWTHACYGPRLAVAGGFRLAFWRERTPAHGGRLDRALDRYERYREARPPAFPEGAVAGFALFLCQHTPRQQDGPEHGMAFDVERFNRLTKQMAAYTHYQRQDHLERAERRAQRRGRVKQLAEQINKRIGFRGSGQARARLHTARALLESGYAAHHRMGERLYAAVQREQRLQQRDLRLMAGQHPGNTDRRYRAACNYAQTWGLPMPPGVRPPMAAAAGEHRG